jgi:DNA-binding Lrp family transcriptional regulator
MLSPDDARLLERLHGDLPLTERPFADVALEFGWTEEYVIGRLSALLESGMLTRFGPLFQIERAGGLFVLAAMAVPEERYEAVTAQVNAHAEIAHNYRRAHALNMWFVLATETPAQCQEAIGTHRGRNGPARAGISKRARVFCRTQAPPAPSHRSSPWRLTISTAP